jgi:hypothetical protein
MRTYKSWECMMRRCSDPKHKNGRYVALGITVCQRWKESFIDFLEDMGERTEGKFLDRTDNTKGYFKENCRWATMKEQLQNTVFSKRWIIDGEIYGSLRDAVIKTGIPMTTIMRNVNSGKPGFSKESVYE